MHRMAMQLGTLIAGALIITAMPAQAVKTYKWTDDSGKVHYGSQPPKGSNARELSVSGASSDNHNTPTRGKAKTAPAAEVNSGNNAAKPDDQRGTEDKEWMAKQCQGARKNLEMFSNADTNQRFRRPDGTVVRYTEEELAAERGDAQQFVDKYCKNSTPNNTGS